MPVYKVFGRNIESFISVKRWMKKLKARYRSADRFDESTSKRNALYFLKIFCEMTGKDPDKLIEERTVHLKSDDELVRRQHEELVEDFSTYLREQGKAPSYATTAVGWIRSFYKHNYKKLEDLTVAVGYPTRTYTVPRPPQLRKIVEVADRKAKAWILCQAESGISNIDLLNLTLDNVSPEFGTIKEQLKLGICPIHIRIVRFKTAAAGLGWYDTFWGKNAVEALNEFADLSRNRIFTFSDRYYEALVKKAAFNAKVGTEKAPVTPYCLRRYFKTRMNLANVNELTVEYWMGHKIARVKAGYNAPPVEDQIKVYLEAYPLLDINKVMA